MGKVIKNGLKKFILFVMKIYYIIVHRIKVEGKVNTNQAGTYQIYYYVGKAIAIRTVTVG